MSLKNPVTPPGLDPGTIRLVEQRLNLYATTGPYFMLYGAEVALSPEINTKHINTVWAERTVVEC
jgi:hypothetical protein